MGNKSDSRKNCIYYTHKGRNNHLVEAYIFSGNSVKDAEEQKVDAILLEISTL